jgi:hypothetical protein
VVEMARQTSGYFIPVRRPGDLVHAVGEVSLASLSEVRVSNRTTGEEAPLLRTRSDGTWAGFVPLEAGDNAIEVVARADDGTEARRTLAVRYEEEARPPEIPPDIASLRNALLEDCLAALRRLSLELEKERDERVRRELTLEIERERMHRELRMEIERERLTAKRRAAEQRKRLEISVEAEAAPSP